MATEWAAGRELDREIGVKVFGYSLYHYDKDYAEHCYWQLLDGLDPVAMEHGRGWGERKTPEEAWEDMPYYSTDATAAMTIARRFGRDTVPLADLNQRVMFWAELYRAADEHHYICWPDALGVIDLPLAISRAALKAVEPAS